MNKTFDSLFKFNKGTKFCKLCNLALYDIINMIFVFEVYPRIFCEVLEREIDSLFFWIKADNLKFDFLTFLNKVFWTSNVAPRHIIDVKQSVETTKIDESTKACKALYRTFYSVTNLN